MKKPELLVTAGTIEEALRYIEAGADAINAGDTRYSLRMPGSLKTDDMKEMITAVQQSGAKIYVSVNQLMTNDHLPGLEAYLQQLADWGADAVVFGDPSVLRIVRVKQLPLPLHWNAEMTATNYATANFWIAQGVHRVILARELNMEQVHEAKRQIRGEVQVQVHGLTNIYHSKRKLVTSYMEHRWSKKDPASEQKNELEQYGPEQNLYIVEPERRSLHMPIYEDEYGTHIMSPDDLCMVENLSELLSEPLDSLKIEGLLKTPEYNETVTKIYRQAIDSYCHNPEEFEFQDEWFSEIARIQEKKRELSYGFYYKEQVY